MSTVEIETGRYVKRFAFWNPVTWSIPKLYWDAWSQEQRVHAICRQLEKVIAYADYLGVNVDDIAARLKAIEDGQLDELIAQAVEDWFEENAPQLLYDVQDLQAALPISEYDAEHTVKDAIDGINAIIGEGFTDEETIAKVISDDKTELKGDIAALQAKSIPNQINAMEGLFRFECTGGDHLNGGIRFKSTDDNLYWAVIVASTVCIYDESGTLQVSLYDAAIDHGQNCAFVDGFLYVTSGTAYRKYNISHTGATFIEEIILSEYPTIFDATLDDKNYYIWDTGGLHVVDRETEEELIVKTASEIGVSNPGNGMFCWDKYGAICLNRFSTNYIVMLDKETLDPIETIAVNENYGYLNMFEPEFGFADGDDLYIGVNNGYNIATDSKYDIAPQTVMHTNIFANVGMSSNFSDVHPSVGYFDMKTIVIDYVNGDELPILPNDFITDLTVKYPQDAAALANAIKKDTFAYIRVTTDCPIVLAFSNLNFRLTLAAKVPGVKLVGCYATVEDGNGNLVANVANWLLSQSSVNYGIIASDSRAQLIIGSVGNLDNTTNKLAFLQRCDTIISSGSKAYCKYTNCSFLQGENN